MCIFASDLIPLSIYITYLGAKLEKKCNMAKHYNKNIEI